MAENNFKWFGEGFEGFPRSLPEDCVEYTIYLVDTKLQDLEKRQRLREIQSAGLKLTSELTNGFIWQREGISLALQRENGRSLLRGRTNYGDSIDDEWLVVYMLRELSRKFPDIWIRVVDTDGQFLLIEAAGVLPRWLNPETADFRVWLNNGKVLIIPSNEPDIKTNRAKLEQKSPGLEEALKVLENDRAQMIDSPTIQAEAFQRLQKYPNQILDSLHHALVRVPRKLAYILHKDAAYISPAIEAFYLRDPIALRPLQSQDSTLLFPPGDCVQVSVRFTKVGYAQLKSQQFAPPNRWAEVLRLKHGLKPQVEAELGMKISSGFEMLMSDPQNQDRKAVREIKLLLDDLEVGEDSLPSETEIRNWGLREDDETWLDINFQDFEKELGGKGSRGPPDTKGGFGDKAAQDNLRKIVTRFEDFLNDDAAGAEGAEYLDDMDEDDDDDEDSTSGDDDQHADETGDISFNEDEFTSMLREMMGMPTSNLPSTESRDPSTVNFSNSGCHDQDKDIRQDMNAIEKELQQDGALDLNAKEDFPKLKRPAMAISTRSGGSDTSGVSDAPEVESGDEDVNVDLNLAKTLLESFKSQSGASGPGSNLMGLLGMQMPRDS